MQKHFSQKQLILEPVSLRPEEFDAAIARFDGVLQEHSVAFSQARWPKIKLEAWAYNGAGVMKAAVLVLIQALPAQTGHLAIVKWGPVLADELAEDAKAVEQAVFAHLKAHYGDARGMMLSISAKAETPGDASHFNWLLSNGFKPAKALPFPSRYHINVRLSDADQRKSFAQKWRYHLNKAEKSGLGFEVAGPEQLQRFQALYDAMTARKNFPDYSAYPTLPHLCAQWPHEMQPQLFFVTHQGQDVAGAVIFKAGRTAVYLYGATNDEALPLRAGYLLHARIISWLRDHSRADWYDLGGTDGFQGLQQFKKGMVGTAGRIVKVPAVVHYAASAKMRVLGHGAYLARDGVARLRSLADKARGRYAKPDQPRDENA